MKPSTSGVKTANKEEQNALEKLCSAFATERSEIESILIEQTCSAVKTIPDVSGYLVGSGGKRIRPLVALAAARAARPDITTSPKKILYLAAAVEFIHSATLLHDDVVDDSKLRRGKTVAKNIWGAAASILVGDFLFARSFNLMLATKSMRVLDILANASSTIAEGEVRQLAARGRMDLQQNDYLDIADAKTAVLFKAAAHAAAVALDAPDNVCSALAEYGRRLGRAFQLTDDVLDYGGQSPETGKPVGRDFLEGMVTLPALIARKRGNEKDKHFWDKNIAASSRSHDDLKEAIHKIIQTDAATAVLQIARNETTLARNALEDIPSTPMRTMLENLAAYCVERTA